MRKFFFVLALAAVLVPVLSFPAAAVSFDFNTPITYSPPAAGWDELRAYHTIYTEQDTGEIWVDHYNGTPAFSYYDDGGVFRWVLGSYVSEIDTDYHVTLNPFDSNNSYGRFSSADNLKNTLVFVNILFPNVIIPAQSGQYFKAKFNIHSNYDVNNGDWSIYPADYKSIVDELTVASNLCMFMVRDEGSAWQPRQAVVVPSAVTVRRDSGTTTTNKGFQGDNMEFTYYFDLSYSFFEEILQFDYVGLMIRIPYFFGTYGNKPRVIGNLTIPDSYEIISANDYSNALNDINISIDAVNSSVNKVYDALTNNPDAAADQIVITGFKANTDKLGNTVGDYNDAQAEVDKIVSNVTLPTVTLASPDVMDDIGLGEFSQNNDIWNSYTVGMVVVAFSFATISLILYGKKGSGS